MNRDDILNHIKTKLTLVPKLPGCYQMYNKDKEIIYVGKAKILQNRLKSYFTGSHDAKTTRMLQDVVNFEYIITQSEKEAFLLESNFIKKYRPRYNILLMDDKTYPYIALTNEAHPRLIYTRDIKKETRRKNKYIFGPYPNVKGARDIVEILNKAYPFRKCNIIPKKKCLYAHIGQCLAPCENEVSKDAYDEYIKSTIRFLNGSDTELVDRINRLMIDASNRLEFEQALEYRDTLNAIKDITEKQTMELNDQIARDVFGYSYQDGMICIQVLHMRAGKIIERSQEIFEIIEDKDSALLSYMYQFYDSQLNIKPKEVIIPYIKDYEMLEELLDIKFNIPVKGIKKKLLDNATLNAKNNFENMKKLRLLQISKTKTPLEELAKLLDIEYPQTIEIFDNSNIQGVSAVSAMVKYIDGRPAPKEYRKYKVKTVEGADDYHTMMEVIERRYKRLLLEDLPLPNLIIVDGGTLQVNAAKESLTKLGIIDKVNLIGLLKDDNHKTHAIVTSSLEEVNLNKRSDLFLLLEAMQDEVHRFAITFFNKTHNKNALTSILDEVKGLGKRRKQTIFENFENIYEIDESSRDKLKSLGIPKNVIDEVINKISQASNSSK